MTQYAPHDIIAVTHAGPLLGLGSGHVAERLARMGVPLIHGVERVSSGGKKSVYHFVRVADLDAARGSPAHLVELEAVNKRRIKLHKYHTLQDIHGNVVPYVPPVEVKKVEEAPAPLEKWGDRLAEISDRLAAVEASVQTRDFRIAKLYQRVGEMQERISALLVSLGETPLTKRADDANGVRTNA